MIACGELALYPVATVGFGAIERGVSTLQYHLNRLRDGAGNRKAYTGGNCNRCTIRSAYNRFLADNGAKTFGDDLNDRKVGIGENDQKFFAPDTRDQIEITHVARKASPEFLQYSVARVMSEFVIHLFKIIDIQHQNGKYLFLLP